MGFSKELIAPCGMNCGVCIAYLRDKNKCYGCMQEGSNKAAHCTKCSIKYCDEHNHADFTYCYDCRKFPCTRIKKLDKRYVQNYKTSLSENLSYISQHGMEAFICAENEKWQCKNCGSVLSVHRNECLNCKVQYRE